MSGDEREISMETLMLSAAVWFKRFNYSQLSLRLAIRFAMPSKYHFPQSIAKLAIALNLRQLHLHFIYHRRDPRARIRVTAKIARWTPNGWLAESMRRGECIIPVHEMQTRWSHFVQSFLQILWIRNSLLQPLAQFIFFVFSSAAPTANGVAIAKTIKITKRKRRRRSGETQKRATEKKTKKCLNFCVVDYTHFVERFVFFQLGALCACALWISSAVLFPSISFSFQRVFCSAQFANDRERCMGRRAVRVMCVPNDKN